MNKNFGVFIILFFILALKTGYTQYSSSFSYENLFHAEKIDTAVLLSDQPLKSPWGAVGRSALLPGWGQIYTGHYFKAALYFSVNAFFVYQIYHYEMKWRDEKIEDYRNKRNQFTWYFVFAYLITMVDAYVDAYLYKFDEAIEISQFIERREESWYSEFRFTYHF